MLAGSVERNMAAGGTRPRNDFAERFEIAQNMIDKYRDVKRSLTVATVHYSGKN